MASRKSPHPKDKQQTAGSVLDLDRLLTTSEVADYLGIEPGTLDQWASRGGGPLFHKIGVHRRYAPADIRAFLAERRRATTGDSAPAA